MGGITGARETAVGGRGFCATVDDNITAVTLLEPLKTGIVVTATVTKVNTIFDGHVYGAGISSRNEGSALNVIPTDML